MRIPALKLLLAVLALALYAQRGHGQSVSPPSAVCPAVRVSCADFAHPDTPLVFGAEVGGSTDPGLTYRWRVSAGRIVRGQGTPSLTLDVSEPRGGSFEGTVEVGGLPESCARTASCVTHVISDPLTRCIDEYGNISFKEEMARLDNFAIELQNDPTALGYILCYGGRVGRAGEARARCDRAKNYVARRRGVEAARLVTVDGGHREYLFVQLCVVPQGVMPPAASPTVEPRDVKIIRPRPARRKRRRP